MDVRTANRATEILMEDGKVAGVKVETANGEYTISSPYVAICTGGYGGGEEALEKFAPSRLGYVCTAAKSSTGDGLLMAEAVGAQIVNAESITYRTIAAGVDNVGGAIGLHNAPSAGAIIVNKEGKRFASEIGDDEALVLGIQAQTGGVGYVIMDQAAMDARYDVSRPVYSRHLCKTSLPRRIRWKNWRKRWESMPSSWLQPWRNIMPLSKRAWTRLSARESAEQA